MKNIKSSFKLGMVVGLFLCVLLPTAEGFIVGPVKVRGVVISYNKTVVLLKHGGKKFRVPRSSIPKKFKLRTGKKVYALLKTEPLQSELRRWPAKSRSAKVK